MTTGAARYKLRLTSTLDRIESRIAGFRSIQRCGDVQVSDSEASPGYPQCPSVPVSLLWGIGKGARGRGAEDEGAEQTTASRGMPGVWDPDPAAVVVSRFAWPVAERWFAWLHGRGTGTRARRSSCTASGSLSV
jgi:hypothetical protein